MGTGVESGLLDQPPHRSLDQVEILADLPNRPITTMTQLNDLGLELRRERPTRPRTLSTLLSMMLDVLPEIPGPRSGMSVKKGQAYYGSGYPTTHWPI